MTEKEKELLCKDICTRLPYGVKVGTTDNDGSLKNVWDVLWYNTYTEDVELTHSTEDANKMVDISEVKPYLFPLSSMTEEQKREYNRRKHKIPVCRYEYGDVVSEEIELYDSPYSFEYLIENHFDVYGLIPMGLAKDATNLNVY